MTTIEAAVTSIGTTIKLNQKGSAGFVAAVKATALAASNDAVRDILNNVLVIIGNDEIKFVATNSYMLFVSTLGPAEVPPGEMGFMLNAKQLVAALPKGKPLISLNIDVPNARLILIDHNDASERSLAFRPGTFPDWQSLIKDEPVPQAFKVGVNPTFLGTIAKAADIFRPKDTGTPLRMRTGTSDMKPMYFELTAVDRGTFFALLMPTRIP